jgi:tetratricopeptide (TPR) repeat protein
MRKKIFLTLTIAVAGFATAIPSTPGQGRGGAITHAISLREKRLGPDHPDVARSVTNLGTIEDERGNEAPARAAFLRSLSIFERTGVGLDVAMANANIGVFFARRGDRVQARVHFERANAIQKEVLGDHPSTVLSLANLGDLELDDGNAKAALERFQDAAAMLDRIHSSNGQLRGACLTGLGRAALRTHDLARAEKALEDALAVYAGGTFAPEERAEAEFALAQALAARGKDTARARGLAEQAQDDLAGDGNRARRGDVAAWLARR